MGRHILTVLEGHAVLRWTCSRACRACRTENTGEGAPSSPLTKNARDRSLWRLLVDNLAAQEDIVLSALPLAALPNSRRALRPPVLPTDLLPTFIVCRSLQLCSVADRPTRVVRPFLRLCRRPTDDLLLAHQLQRKLCLTDLCTQVQNSSFVCIISGLQKPQPKSARFARKRSAIPPRRSTADFGQTPPAASAAETATQSSDTRTPRSQSLPPAW